VHGVSERRVWEGVEEKSAKEKDEEMMIMSVLKIDRSL
jgi:hypothetical protein